MNIFSIAYNNFKGNVKTYMSFFVAMVFSVVILINFEFLKYGDAIKRLNGENSRFTSTILVIVIMVLSIFLFFFIWYATNIFFKNRSKEIGILSFMGLDLSTIGKIYFVENMLIGISACIAGIVIGVVTSRFFQVIIIKMSGFKIEISNGISVNAILEGSIIFLAIFTLMAIKGFIIICRSSVINLINASKKEEKIPTVGIGLYLLAIASICFIGYGYYKSFDIRSGNITDIVPVIIIVIVGTYGLFKSVLPVIFNIIMKNKKILFDGENIIALNNINYRLSKNYKTYAIIAIVLTATISTLGAAVAIKYKQEDAATQRNIYTVSMASAYKNELNKKTIEDVINKTNNIKYEISSEVAVLENPDSINDYDTTNTIMKYSEFANILKSNGNEDVLKEYTKDLVSDNKVMELKSPQTIMSLAVKEKDVNLGGEIYNISVNEIKVPVLGTIYSQSIYVVSDETYDKLEDKGEKIYVYGAKVEDEANSEAMFNNLAGNIHETKVYMQNGYKAQEEGEWMKFAYAILVFLFIVFAIVAGSIIYMKIYNDACEDKEKYSILIKIGATEKEINKAILKEVVLFYTLPMISAGISSFFSIKIGGEILMSNLNEIYILSVVVCLIIFMIYGVLSVNKFKKIVYSN